MFLPRNILALLLGLSLSGITLAAPNNLWHGKRAAIALTYDDALNIDLDNVLPELNKYNLKATFYLIVSSPAFSQRLNEWRTAAAQGHELGNHTLFHPCNGSLPGREWVAADRDLSKWSVQRIVNNIKVGNTALQALDGEQDRTFAYPCGDTEAGGKSYVNAIKPLFVAARGVQDGLQNPQQVSLFDIRTHMVNGESTQQLKSRVDAAIKDGALLVFLFHGVGGEHNINVAKQNHDELLKYIHQQQDKLWVAPMVDIARFIKQQQP